MASDNERFFELGSFAVVGNTDLSPFPGVIYAELRDSGRTVYPVDLGGSRYIQGDEAFPSLHDLPIKVAGVVVVLPRHRVDAVIEQMVELGMSDLWAQGGASPQVVSTCREREIHLIDGIDARAYTSKGFSFSRLLLKLTGRY